MNVLSEFADFVGSTSSIIQSLLPNFGTYDRQIIKNNLNNYLKSILNLFAIDESLIPANDIMNELEIQIDSSILVNIVQKSNELGDDFLECVIQAMGILTEIFYHEMDNQIKWLSKLNLVEAIRVCHPELRKEKVYCKLVTNMCLNKPELLLYC